MAINFHIKTKDIDLTPDISSQIHDKLGAIEKFLVPQEGQTILAEVDIARRQKKKRKGDVYRAEVNVSLAGMMYRAVTKGESITAALDELKDEISKVVRRDQGKQNTQLRSGQRLLKKLFRRN